MTANAFDLRGATADLFAPLVGERFQVATEESGEVAAEFVLSELEGPKEGRQRPFSLFFRGPKDVAFPQMTLFLRHPKLGSIGLFLVPVGADENGRDYQAVFN